MSSEIFTCEKAISAVAVLYRDFTDRGKEPLSKVCKDLEPSDTVAIELLLTTEDASKIYRGANIALSSFAHNGCDVDVTLGAYSEGKYTHQLSNEELASPDAAKGAPDVVSFAVKRYTLVSDFDQCFNAHRSKNPKAYNVASAVQQIFKYGVPLPTDESFRNCTFKVVVQTPKGHEFLYASRGVRGLFDTKWVSSTWWSYGTALETEIRAFFDKMTKAAKGEGKPTEVPPMAVSIVMKTTRGPLENMVADDNAHDSTAFIAADGIGDRPLGRGSFADGLDLMLADKIDELDGHNRMLP